MLTTPAGTFTPITPSGASSSRVPSLESKNPFNDLYVALSSSTTIPANDAQPSNTPLPMLVTQAGITTFVNELHPKNALSATTVTLLGINRSSIEAQPLNALSHMAVTPSGIETSMEAFGQTSICVPSFERSIPFTDAYSELSASTAISTSETHSPKAEAHMFVTLEGMKTFVNELQPRKTLSEISSTPSEIVKSERDVHW